MHRSSTDFHLQGWGTSSLPPQPRNRTAQLRLRRTENGCQLLARSRPDQAGLWRSKVCARKFHTLPSFNHYLPCRQRHVLPVYDVRSAYMSPSSIDSAALNMDESALYYLLSGAESSIMGEGTTEEPLYWEQYPHGYGHAVNSRSGSGLFEDNPTPFTPMGYNEFGSNPEALTTPEGNMIQYNACEDLSAFSDPVEFTDSPFITEVSTPPLGLTHPSAFSGTVEYTCGPYTGGPFTSGPFTGGPYTTGASTPALGLTHPSALGEQPGQVNQFSLATQNRPSQPVRQDSSSESSLPPSPPQCSPDQQPLSPFELPEDDIVAAQLMGLNIAPKKTTDSPGNVQQSQVRGPSSSPTRSPSQSSTDSETPRPKYACLTCGVVFKEHSGRTSLARHKKYGRKDGLCKKGKIRCNVRGCGKEFRRSDSLTKHKRVHHRH